MFRLMRSIALAVAVQAEILKQTLKPGNHLIGSTHHVPSLHFSSSEECLWPKRIKAIRSNFLDWDFRSKSPFGPRITPAHGARGGGGRCPSHKTPLGGIDKGTLDVPGNVKTTTQFGAGRALTKNSVMHGSRHLIG
jgi:hypothetical protein